MGYKALLFCPDEKTARTVTQVLGDLEFSVESCTEPFAAVKKLMSDHFDAIVVDCDNEQNATLLFKSARNSTSNQASLAVAVVEGQAGVAKAFRIGANLVLTKPINVEQAKGTLRVARGLLRKGEPAKPAASAPTPAASASAPAASPAKPASHPVPPAKPAAAVSTPRPAAPLPPRPSPLPPRPVPAVAASSAPAANHDDDPLEINVDEPVSTAPVLPSPKLPAHSAAAAAAETKPAFSAASTNTMGSFGGGAASAPAPAREVQVPHAAPASPAAAPEADEPLFAKSAEAAPSSSPAPTFTFGGANVPESSGSNKKLLLVAAAVVLVAAGAIRRMVVFSGTLFAACRQHGHGASAGRRDSGLSTPAPKPSSIQPASSAPSTPVSSPSSQPACAACITAGRDRSSASNKNDKRCR